MQSDARQIYAALKWAAIRHPRLQFSATALTSEMHSPTRTGYRLGRQALAFELYKPLPQRIGAGVTSLVYSPLAPAPFSGSVKGDLYGICDASSRSPRALIMVAVMFGNSAIDIVCCRNRIRTAGAYSAETSGAVILQHRMLPARGVLSQLFLPQLGPNVAMTDAKSVLFASGGGSSIRHTPWLLGRIGELLQAVEDKEIKYAKILGTLNPTNSGTKYTSGDECNRDMAFLAGHPTPTIAAATCVPDTLDGIVALSLKPPPSAKRDIGYGAPATSPP